MAKIKVIALHVITRVLTPGEHGNKEKGIPPKKPKTQDIAPGTHFMLDPKSDEYKELKAANAIRDFDAKDAAAFKQFTEVLNAENTPEGEGSGEGEGEGSGDDGTASVKTTTTKTTTKKSAKAEGDGSDLV